MAAMFRSAMQIVRLESQSCGGAVRNQIRGINKSCRRFDKTENIQTSLSDHHVPTNLERKVLVWTKMYPNVESIPETVSLRKVRKARDLFRIRVNIGMIAVTVVGCGLMMYTGRKARKEGQSISKQGLEWQKRMQEKGRQERAAAAEAAAKEQ